MPATTNTRFAVAVHVLTYLAGPGAGRPVTSDELAGSVNVNPVHIRRVLGPLREAGLVQSRSGQHGGWLLGRAPEQVRLDELWAAVGCSEPLVGIHGPDPGCPVGRAIQTAMTGIERDLADVVRAELARRTVRDLLDEVAEPRR